MQRLFDYGHGVGKRATKGFPEGITIDAARENHEEALLKTQDALKSNAQAIFEGAFLYNEVLVRVDILKNNQDGSWDLIEVKSSRIKPNPHYDDIAIQKWVVSGSGLNIRNAYLMTPVRGYTPGAILDPSQKFTLHKVDQEISSHIARIENQLSQFQTHLNANEPIQSRGNQCNDPYECEFKKYCKKLN